MRFERGFPRTFPTRNKALFAERDLFRGPKGRSRKKSGCREKWFLKTSRGSMWTAWTSSHALPRETLHVAGASSLRGPREAHRGTANYYLIARITEYNSNRPRPLKAAATTPGINEPWPLGYKFRVKYCVQNVVKLQFTSIRQDLPRTHRTGSYACSANASARRLFRI